MLEDENTPTPDEPAVLDSGAEDSDSQQTPDQDGTPPVAPMVLFQAPENTPVKSTRRAAVVETDDEDDDESSEDQDDAADEESDGDADAAGDAGTDDNDGDGGQRRRRRRGGRRRRKPSGGNAGGDSAEDDSDEDESDDGSDSSASDEDSTEGEDSTESGSRRRRRRRRPGEGSDADSENGQSSTAKARKQRSPEDEITSVQGSTRLEAKKQRRREGREAGRRRAPIISEAEFLARREAVARVMVIRQREDLTQIAVLEDDVLVEHYVARDSQTSMIGDVYLGRVQNVLPSMEAAFVDIGKGRNAVLYAGEVNWAALGHQEGQPRKVESVLSSGQPILVQVTKDPVGHKGARLTAQISIPGRFLVYVPEGNTSGISRKLPDTERNRLKRLLKEIVPETAGVIVRTAAEGASEAELTRDVERLTARWNDIEQKVKSGKAPQLLYKEPDLTLKVVRDLFTEDFAKLVIQGDEAWELVDQYVEHVAPDLRERLEHFGAEQDDADPAGSGSTAADESDVFAAYRIDEQIAKGLERKVWLPSGGSLVIDRTEAMTVVDVNTGKFTGSGGNLEETVTKNNLEAAEEIVRQLRLRDIGGIIVIDFIDMVLENNRDLVLRRLVECLGRDRTRHQVAEVTSLGLVQMTRKRIGIGLLEAFSTECEHCKGRGVMIHDHPVAHQQAEDEHRGRRGRGGRSRSRSGSGGGSGNGGSAGNGGAVPSPADLAGKKPPEKTEPEAESQSQPESQPDSEPESPQEPASAEPTPPVAVETAPKVVTRRRSARRPAGPPPGAEAPTAAAGQLGVAGAEAPASAEPFDVPVEPAVPGHSAESGSQGVAEGDQDPAAAEAEADNANVAHVPIKKKGARKR